MAILDVWGNPLGTSTVTAIGYRGEFEQFPHDLYSFILSSIREADQADIALLYRWLRPMQNLWEQQYSAILSLYNLYSPENCATELLDYLRKNVGILDDLSYVWGVMTELEKRRFIKYFVRFLMYRGTDFGVHEIIRTMTGYPAELHGYFYYRWILSGEGDLNTATAIGREDDDSDPWLISEYEVPVGYQPDSISIVLNTSTGYYQYRFVVNSLVAAVTNLPVQDQVIVRCRLTGKTFIADLHLVSGDYELLLPDDYFFEQSLATASTTTTDFVVGFQIDQYVSDLLIVDDGTINRAMLRGLVRFSRPMSERVYLRYYNLIEDFSSRDRWEITTGEVELDKTNKTVLLGSTVLTTLTLDYLASATWSDYGLIVKCQCGVNDRYSEIRFMYQDTDNYYYLRFTPNTPPSWPPGSWRLGRVVAAADTALASGETEWLDLDVDYVWRIECFTSHRPTVDVQILRIYQDENLLADVVDNPVPWTSVAGTIQLATQANSQLLVTKVQCNPIPMDVDFVGPTV